MFDLDDSWVWDFWLADDGERYHAYFLHAPRALGDPELRHAHARIGRATSTDLTDWSPAPLSLDPMLAAEEKASWTGWVVRADTRWWMFRTSVSAAYDGFVQSIVAETSSDLETWERARGEWPLGPDERWYAAVGPGAKDQAFRDPFVVRGDDGLWHLYATADARPPVPAGKGRGVIAHATSPDLVAWTPTVPLGGLDKFGHIETIQVVEVDGQWVVIFSCHAAEMVGATAGQGGVWTVPTASPGQPVDLSQAVRLTDECVYVGRVIEDRSGNWQFLAFINQGPNGEFVGGICDPVPVRWRADGAGLELERQPVPWCHGEGSHSVSISA